MLIQHFGRRMTTEDNSEALAEELSTRRSIFELQVRLHSKALNFSSAYSLAKTRRLLTHQTHPYTPPSNLCTYLTRRSSLLTRFLPLCK